jgi:hypothetical protein
MSSGVTGEARIVSCRALRSSGDDRWLRKTPSRSCTLGDWLFSRFRNEGGLTR